MSALEHYETPLSDEEFELNLSGYYASLVYRGEMTQEQADAAYRHAELGGTALAGY